MTSQPVMIGGGDLKRIVKRLSSKRRKYIILRDFFLISKSKIREIISLTGSISPKMFYSTFGARYLEHLVVTVNVKHLAKHLII